MLAIAWDESFTNVNLERKHLLASGFWGTASNWVGNKVPDITTDAYVLDGLSASMSVNAEAQNLTLDSGGVLFTNAFDLRVKTDTRIGTSSTLFVAGEARLNRGFITGSGTISLLGGMLIVEDLDNDASTGAGISGNGFIRINGILTNNGKIAPLGGLMQISGPGEIDLDGDTSDDGLVELLAGDLESGASPTDNFDGLMTIGAGHAAAMTSFNLGENGTLRLWGNVADPATMPGRQPRVPRCCRGRRRRCDLRGHRRFSQHRGGGHAR